MASRTFYEVVTALRRGAYTKTGDIVVDSLTNNDLLVLVSDKEFGSWLIDNYFNSYNQEEFALSVSTMDKLYQNILNILSSPVTPKEMQLAIAERERKLFYSSYIPFSEEEMDIWLSDAIVNYLNSFRPTTEDRLEVGEMLTSRRLDTFYESAPGLRALEEIFIIAQPYRGGGIWTWVSQNMAQDLLFALTEDISGRIGCNGSDTTLKYPNLIYQLVGFHSFISSKPPDWTLYRRAIAISRLPTRPQLWIFHRLYLSGQDFNISAPYPRRYVELFLQIKPSQITELQKENLDTELLALDLCWEFDPILTKVFGPL